MKYFYDTEFYERPNQIDLISIGIVCEDGREYYAINHDAPFGSIKKNSPWLKENVLSQLPGRWPWPSGDYKTSDTIAKELREFFDPKDDAIELWAYYGAYDHVVLMWLFGPMIDKPEQLPMFSYDIRAFACDEALPVQKTGLHNALEDARWNKLAHDSINRFN